MSRFMGGLHKCAVAGCSMRIPRKHFMCSAHYESLPAWLTRKLQDERSYGEAWKCHPTQKYLELRDQAVKTALAEHARRYAKPAGLQLPLLPT